MNKNTEKIKNITKYQNKLKKTYYNFNKGLLKTQYFSKKGAMKQLQTISALEGFITYLRYLRDSVFVDEIAAADYKTKEFEGSTFLNLITLAIDEYEKSQSCINNYFNIDFSKLDSKDLNDIISTKDANTDTTFEQAQNNYMKEWQQHWNKFWALAAKCIDLSLYGTSL